VTSNTTHALQEMASEHLEIDPNIKPLIELLQATGGINTTACIKGERYPPQAPVIYFNATIQTARELDRCLHTIWMNKENGLNYYWTISGRFDVNKDFDLTYILHAPFLDSRSNDSSLLGLIQWVHPISTRKDRDLATLIRQLPPLLLQLGDGDKPSVCQG
jgi:hypothetical protein